MENKNALALRMQFEEIYSDYAHKIYNYVYLRTLQRESAENLTSAIFFEVLQNLHSYDTSNTTVGEWISTIARITVNDYVAKKTFQRESLTDEISEPYEKLYKILIKLADDERDFLELRYSLELKNQEIADILGMNVESVDNRYLQLLEKCRNIVEGNVKKISVEREQIILNRNAESFKNYLADKKIEVFEIEELEDEQKTTIFRSQIIVAGQQLPTLVILDKSVFALIRVQIASQVLSDENRFALLDFINEENFNYKPFKFYFNQSGTLFLDLCMPVEGNVSGDMIYLMFNVIIHYLEGGYKKIMKKIWQ